MLYMLFLAQSLSRSVVGRICLDETGAIGDYISTTMLAGMAVVIGLTVIGFVPGVIHTWITNLLNACLPTTSSASASTCP